MVLVELMNSASNGPVDISATQEWTRELVPAKQHVRSETVDLQRGEAEWSGGNLYFDQWDYGFKAEVLAPPQGRGQ
jgi:hypothetical protein